MNGMEKAVKFQDSF